MRRLIHWVRERLADPRPAYTVEEVRRLAAEECDGLGTRAEREEYVAAHVALSEADWRDYRARIRDETPEYLAANRRVAAAERAIGLAEVEP